MVDTVIPSDKAFKGYEIVDDEELSSLGAPLWMELDLENVIDWMASEYNVKQGARGQEQTYTVPRFGVYSTLLEKTPVFIYGDPRLVQRWGNTAFTDGIHIFICADFYKQIIADEDSSNGKEKGVVPLVLHELGHILDEDCFRLRQYDPVLANIAQDYLRNTTLRLEFPSLIFAKSLTENAVGFAPGDLEKYPYLSQEIVAEELYAKAKQKEQEKEKEKYKKLSMPGMSGSQEEDDDLDTDQIEIEIEDEDEDEAQADSENKDKKSSSKKSAKPAPKKDSQDKDNQEEVDEDSEDGDAQSNEKSSEKGNKSKKGGASGESSEQTEEESQSDKNKSENTERPEEGSMDDVENDTDSEDESSEGESDEDEDESDEDSSGEDDDDHENDVDDSDSGKDQSSDSAADGQAPEPGDGGNSPSGAPVDKDGNIKFGAKGDIHHHSLKDVIKALEECGLDRVLDKLNLPHSDDEKAIEEKESEGLSVKNQSVFEADVKRQELSMPSFPGAHSLDCAMERIKVLQKGKLTWKLKIINEIWGTGFNFKYNNDVVGDIYYVDELIDVIGMNLYMGQILPFKSKDVVAIIIDTSGSVGQKDLEDIVPEIIEMKLAAQGSSGAYEVVVFSADTILRGEPIEINEQNVHEVLSGGLQIFGRGGTSLEMAIQQTVKSQVFKDKKIKSLIYFTDLGDRAPRYERLGLDPDTSLTYIAVPSVNNFAVEAFAKEVEHYADVIKIQEGVEVDLSITPRVKESNGMIPS